MLRSIFYKSWVVPAAVLTAVSCVSPAADQDAAYGVLDMGSLTAAVAEENVTRSSTRAVDTDAFTVRLLDKNQAVAGEWIYADCPPEVTLPVGDYTLEVCSPLPGDAEWETPWYAGSESFTIVKDDRTELENVVCRLSNVKVTVHYSEELKELLNGDSQVTIGVGANELIYGFTERRAGYFLIAGEQAALTVIFEGTIDGIHDRYTHVVEGVKPGEWRRVRFTFEENDGFRTFLVTVYDSTAGQIGDGSEWL